MASRKNVKKNSAAAKRYEAASRAVDSYPQRLRLSSDSADIRLIQKWLKTGVLDQGRVEAT